MGTYAARVSLFAVHLRLCVSFHRQVLLERCRMRIRSPRYLYRDHLQPGGRLLSDATRFSYMAQSFLRTLCCSCAYSRCERLPCVATLGWCLSACC